MTTTKKKTSRRSKVKSIRPPAPAPEFMTTVEYVNRELGALEFNFRVLSEALSTKNPLLERVRFLAIFNSNLDEFFMKRVGGLKRQVMAGVTNKTSDGLDPQGHLTAIRGRVLPLLKMAREAFEKDILPAFEKNAIALLSFQDLKPTEKEWANQYFKKNIFPILTPLAVDPGHPFPFLSNLSVSLGVNLKHPDRDEKLFARIKVPRNFSQWIRVDLPDSREAYRFVNLVSLIVANLQSLFPQMQIREVMPFRVTRNADIERDEEDAEDLLEMIEEELKARRFANVLRLEHTPNPDPGMLKFLMDELELTEADVYEMPPQLEFTGLTTIADLQIPALKYPIWNPPPPLPFLDEEANVFSVIRSQDVLVHHPYESFANSVERFLKAAVDDPKVLAIKMTLYRTGDNSPLISLLVRAAEMGKQVVCLVELKARFDEARNIYWAQELEKSGVHVVYGVVGLKTHAKTILVVRDEPDGVKSYVHIGTGNYHSGTSKVYTDLGFFSTKDALAEDVIELFHFLTGRSLKKDYHKLVVAPINMRDRFLMMIDREIDQRKAGKEAMIIVKSNSLDDDQLMKRLYKASQAGVRVELLIRGFCCLRPQVPGLSENIQVRSIVGRYLEHSRVYYFRNGASDPVAGEFLIGSADMMARNLNYRVEALVPIEEQSHRERLWEMLQLALNDRVQGWVMQNDGTYKRQTTTDANAMGLHESLMQLTRQRFRQAQEVRPERS